MIRRAFRVHSNDWPDAKRLFALSFLASMAYTLHRSLADGISVSRLPVGQFLLTHAAGTLLAGLGGWAMTRVTRRLPPASLLRGTHVALALLVACVFALEDIVRAGPTSLVWSVTIYLLVELRGSLHSVQISVVLNETFPLLKARAVTSFVSAGATLAGLVGGVLAGAEAVLFGADLVVLCLIALDLGVAWIALPTGNASRLERRPGARARLSPDEKRTLARRGKRLVRWLFLLVIAKGMFLGLVSCYWKIESAAWFATDASHLIAWFAWFHAGCAALVLVAQLFVSGALLQRFGPAIGLLAMPVLVAVVLLATPLWPGPTPWFVLLTLLSSLNVVRRGLHDPALHLVFAPLPLGARRRAIGWVSGVARPLAESSVAGLLLVAVLSDDVSSLRPLLPVLTLVWVLAAWGAIRRHRALVAESPRSGVR